MNFRFGRLRQIIHDSVPPQYHRHSIMNFTNRCQGGCGQNHKSNTVRLHAAVFTIPYSGKAAAIIATKLKIMGLRSLPSILWPFIKSIRWNNTATADKKRRKSRLLMHTLRPGVNQQPGVRIGKPRRKPPCGLNQFHPSIFKPHHRGLLPRGNVVPRRRQFIHHQTGQGGNNNRRLGNCEPSAH